MKRILIAASIIPIAAALLWAAPLRQDLLPQGRVAEVGLDRLAPVDLKDACLLFRNKQAEAKARVRPIFAAYLRQHPHSFLAYIGLSQASRSFRVSELARLEKETAKEDVLTLFQHGLQLYYAGVQENDLPGYAKIRTAKGYLEQARQKSEDPLMALLLIEIYDRLAPKMREPLTLTLIEREAGPQAFALYQAAGRRGWQGETPAPALTPAKTRSALGAFVAERRALLATRGFSRTTNAQGISTPWKETPRAPGRREEAAYLKRWRDALFAAQDEQGQKKAAAVKP